MSTQLSTVSKKYFWFLFVVDWTEEGLNNLSSCYLRFLPGLGGKKCPPVGYPAPYPQSSYPLTGYQIGYPHPQPVHGYPTPYGQPVPTPAYHHPVPNHGYQQPSPVYQNPSSAYQNPSPAYHKPNTGYQNTGYSQPSPVYHQPAPSYPTQTPSYRPPSNSNYRPQSSGYKPSSNSGYNGNFSPSSYPPSPTYQNSGMILYCIKRQFMNKSTEDKYSNKVRSVKIYLFFFWNKS